ncbi:Aminoglycoside phosphotransferase domain-containing protein [Madurella fahalii]|uniref:Aminoglycoside phosphotransferase domain-containing protein n=1 Tax=Madurella fahalii TaxID=1157608 RepID=A0ABQ0G379_9PEZI
MDVSPSLRRSETEQEAGSANDSSQDVEKVWKTWERCVTVKKHSVVKRELSTSGLMLLPNGKVMYPYWAQERLRNEAATLQFVASNTKIPVPGCRLYSKDGLLHLEMTRITNGVLLLDVDEELRAAAVQAVEEQMNSDILPQLRSLRRSCVGSVDATLPVFPPQRVYGIDRRDWPRIASDSNEFVLCHNDLAPQNIFVDPDNFQIVGIIDWEFAVFFPHYFELPLWREFEWAAGKKMYDEARPRELGFFGLTTDDLRDCRVASP